MKKHKVIPIRQNKLRSLYKIKRRTPFYEFMKRKKGVKIQIEKDGLIRILAKKNRKYYVAAKVHVAYEWEYDYLSIANLLLEPCIGRRDYWEVQEYYNSTYTATVIGSTIIDKYDNYIEEGERMPVNSKFINRTRNTEKENKDKEILYIF